MCPKGSGPHSAAKQGRSFRVPALDHPGHVCPRRSRPHSAAKQGRSFRVAALNFALPFGNLKTVPDFGLPSSVHKMCILIRARCQS